MVVGRINDARTADRLVADGQADLVVMCRALLADPELPRKAAEGRFSEIAPCVGCGLGCVVARERGGDMTCLVNPSLGHEGAGALEPAASKRRVLVAGGGPAGMMAAWTAARRGHEVRLFERSERLGGQYNLASVAPGKQELARVVEFLAGRLAATGVAVSLRSAVTEELIARARPGVLVVATGSEPVLPDLPGADGPSVLLAHDVLASRVPRPSGTVLVVGGGMVGCEVADFMASGDGPRAAVTIVEMAGEIGAGMFAEARLLLLERLRLGAARILTSTRVVEIAADGVMVEHVAPEDGGRRERLPPFRWVVAATGARPYRPLEQAAGRLGVATRVIGDAREVRQAVEAVAEGFRAGMEVG